MKKPFIAILALVAGLAGLAIGMAASRSGRGGTRASASSRKIRPLALDKIRRVDAGNRAQPEMATMIGDDEERDSLRQQSTTGAAVSS